MSDNLKQAKPLALIEYLLEKWDYSTICNCVQIKKTNFYYFIYQARGDSVKWLTVSRGTRVMFERRVTFSHNFFLFSSVDRWIDSRFHLSVLTPCVTILFGSTCILYNLHSKESLLLICQTTMSHVTDEKNLVIVSCIFSYHLCVFAGFKCYLDRAWILVDATSHTSGSSRIAPKMSQSCHRRDAIFKLN